jgi:hypothetical protein
MMNAEEAMVAAVEAGDRAETELVAAAHCVASFP